MNKKLGALASTAAAALALNAAPAVAQSQIFLELAGIKGESQSAMFKDQIDVLAWSWGLSQSGTLHIGGGGGGTGKANFQDVSVTKFTDRSSPELYQNLVKGSNIKIGTITVTINNAKGPQPITILKMKPILVTSATTGSTDGEDRPTENITLNFQEFCITQNSIDATGMVTEGDPFCWDIAKNESIGDF